MAGRACGRVARHPIGARYMGPGDAEQYAARNGGPGMLLVRGRINKVVAFSGITD